MPDRGSNRIIRHALAVHEQRAPLIVKRRQLTPDEVHDLRVSVKELRALWQVLHQFLPAGQADDASRSIAGAAKLLAGARDLHIQRRMLDKLQALAREEAQASFRRARELLLSQYQNVTEEALMTAEMVLRLTQDRTRWQQLELSCGRKKLIRIGYGRLYRKARKYWLKANESGHAEDWHRLRCWAKYLALAIPVIGESRDAGNAVKSYSRLAEKLGELHDLDVLVASLRALAGYEEGSATEVITLAEQRAASLRSWCRKKSARLFSERPGSKGGGLIL